MRSQKNRRISAIMFTDIVGYTALMQKDEYAAVKMRERHRTEFKKHHEDYDGEIVQYYGDGTLSVFTSGVKAVECAIAIQKALQRDRPLPLRIGLHLGDIVYDGTEVYGDGVNLASRIESQGIAGSILLSEKLNDELKNQPHIPTLSMGFFELKNIAKPVEIYAVVAEGISVPNTSSPKHFSQKEGKSIAVLPFVNMSADVDNDYFCDGMTEEIINALTKINGLKVTSRTSSFYFKNKNIPIKKIGQDLNVSSILEGSVRLSKDTIRITAQLIEAQNDYHFWSETWDRNLENVFTVQDEISLIIADKIRENFGHFEIQEQLVTKKTENIEAYENYLKGKFHFLKWNQKDAELAITYFEKAIALDPSFVDINCALANCNIYLAATGVYPPEQAFSKAKSYAQKALELDNQNPEVYSVLGGISLWYDWDFEKTFTYLEKAFQLQPNDAELHQTIAMAMMVAGKKETALSHIKIAVKLDPLSVNQKFTEAFIYYMLGDHLKALDLTEKVLISDPTSLPAIIIHECCLLLENRHHEVIAYFEETANPSIDISTKIGMLGLAHVFNKDLVNRDKYLNMLHEQLSSNHAERALSFIFLIHAVSGETNKALDYLEKGINNKSPLLLFLFDDPILTPIMGEERYKNLLKNTFGERSRASLVESKPKQKNKKPLLNDVSTDMYAKKLLAYMEEETPYLDSDLTLRSLAAYITIHPNQLSWLINHEFNKNFNDFINHYRIETFKRISKDPDNSHITLLGLAYDSGFSSKTVFNTSFKKETGMTPMQFIKL